MNKIVLYTKSYSGDLDRLKISIESIKKHNIENIPYYVSVPENEINLFKHNIDCLYVNLVSDNDIYNVPVQNWNTQQIVKSNFWKLGICENYVMLDSDSYFIKDFFISDFMYNDTTPYTVMHEQKDLFMWTSKYGSSTLNFDPYDSFKQDRTKIMNIFGRSGRIYDFGPGPIIWNTKVWKSLEDDYLIPNDLKFQSLIEYCPSEFSWYGEWLLQKRSIELFPIEPIFKFFHFNQQYQYYKQLGYTEQDFAKQYSGIVMQSNWNAPLKF
jgi:hypothetical protein